MKRLIVLLMVLAAAISACTKEELSQAATEESISLSALPASIQQYVAENFPEETIVSASQLKSSSAGYIVSLSSLEELAFSRNGEFMGNGELFHVGDSLCNRHRHDSTPGGGRRDSLPGGGGRGGHHNGKPGHGNGNGIGNLPVDSLPASIAAYVGANFDGYTTRQAQMQTNCQFGQVYSLLLTKDALEPLKLYFDLTGVYLMKSVRALYADAPQAVKDYVAANYVGYEVKLKMQVYTLADNSLQYRVFFGKQNPKPEVWLKPDGTLVCP